MKDDQQPTTERRQPRGIPRPYLESDAELFERTSAAAREAHIALAAALETDLLMMRLRGAGK